MFSGVGSGLRVLKVLKVPKVLKALIVLKVPKVPKVLKVLKLLKVWGFSALEDKESTIRGKGPRVKVYNFII